MKEIEKTLVTKAIGFLVLQGLKLLAKKTDNKIDDLIVGSVEEILQK